MADRPDDASADAGETASRRVSRGILRALEEGTLVPGQRLVETELAQRFGVGRNAVREAVQWLAARGTIEITRFRSAAIRRFDAAETLAVLDVGAALVSLMAAAAAKAYQPSAHGEMLIAALVAVERGDDGPTRFARARRHFYRTLLRIGGNHELERLFPAHGLSIVYAQHRAADLHRQHLDDLRALYAAVRRNDAAAAVAVAQAHIDHIRAAVSAT